MLRIFEVAITSGLAERRRAPGEARATPARHDREVVPRCHLQARHHPVRVPRERDQSGDALDHRGVARVQPERERIVEDVIRSERGHEVPSRSCEVGHARRLRPAMATWAELERGDPALAAFGRQRIEGQVCFQATLRLDGSPRVHPVSPWFGAGLLVVAFRARSPKVDEVARDGRYALHTQMANHEGEGGEFLVSGWMERVADDHPAANARPYTAGYDLATYALSVESAVGTTYETDTPTYRRWRATT